MTIVMREKIMLSEEEVKAVQLVNDILSDIMRESRDFLLLGLVDDASNALCGLIDDYIEVAQEEK